MKSWVYSLLVCQSLTFGFSQEPALATGAPSMPCSQENNPASDDSIETKHAIKVGGVSLSYTAKAGTLTIKDNCQKSKAKVFYVAYTKDDVKDMSQRPITFCFNGGPGSSSVWLHLGAFGPRRLLCDGEGVPDFPFQLVDNLYTLLDCSDLVFVDPVATGYSKPIDGEDSKQFFGLENDANYLSEFIRLYTTKNERWISPKVLMGESYGTTRVSALAYNLQEDHLMFLDGVVLISSVLNWQTIQSRMKYLGNDLACVLSLPSFAASSYYFKKIDTSKSFSDFLKEVEQFSMTTYDQALMKGSLISPDEKTQIIEKISTYTGLSQECIALSNMRLVTGIYTKQILQPEGLIVGRFDSRVKGWDLDPTSSYSSYDPSYEKLALGCSSTINSYFSSELNYKRDEGYMIISDVFPWDYKRNGDTFLNLSLDLRETIIKNNHFKVFVASGYFDLATPYLATEYTIQHMQLPDPLKGNVISKYYPGGHMMYLNEENLRNLKADLSVFYKNLRQKK